MPVNAAQPDASQTMKANVVGMARINKVNLPVAEQSG
jgi:hypothetical protein